MAQLKEQSATADLQLASFSGFEWQNHEEGGINFYSLNSEHANGSKAQTGILTANECLKGQYPGLNITPNVAITPAHVYVERFLEKSRRPGHEFDPDPYIGWSEGDVDTIDGVGDVFFVKEGANFISASDELRFYTHELGHNYAAKISPVYQIASKEQLLATCEGLVESGARIGAGLQVRPDMKFSQDFINSLDLQNLPMPAEIDRTYGECGAFTNTTVSLNPGYATCYLWFLGQAYEVARALGVSGDVAHMYAAGRKEMLEIAATSTTALEYKQGLYGIGFEYDRQSVNPDFLGYARTLNNRFVEEQRTSQSTVFKS